MFWACQTLSTKSQVRNVGHLVRTTAVVHLVFIGAAVYEQTSPVTTVKVSNFTIFKFADVGQIVPGGFCVQILQTKFRNVHIQQYVDRPDNLGKTECRERHQYSVEDLMWRGTIT